LQDVQTEFAGGIDVGVEHGADKLDGRRLVGVLLFEMHHQSKRAVFEGSVSRADNHSIPGKLEVSAETPNTTSATLQGPSHQVITLSATGDADTPAGGSVCMRLKLVSHLL
jgi:hypothetical protein